MLILEQNRVSVSQINLTSFPERRLWGRTSLTQGKYQMNKSLSPKSPLWKTSCGFWC